MLDVLIVSANRERLPDLVPPIGAAYAAAAAAQAGHRVSFADAAFASDQEIAAQARALRPDVIGLALRNVDDASHPSPRSYLAEQRALAAALRSAAPNAKLVLGGSAFSLFPEPYLAALGADHGIVGEAESALPSLLADLDHAPRVVGARLAKDWGRLRPARHLVDMRRYSRQGSGANIQSKRGCAFRCGYCTYPTLEGARVRARPPADVVDEIESVIAEHHVHHFFFVDDVFNTPRSHALALCAEITRRQLDICWSAYVSPAGCTHELLAAMGRAGCTSIDLGTDAGCDEMLHNLGKPFVFADVRRVSSWCKALGIKLSHSLIFGAPGESWATARATVDNMAALDDEQVVIMAGVRIFPGTDVAAHAVKQGLRPDSIGLDPIFFIEPAVEEGLVEFLRKAAARHGFIVPGLGLTVTPRQAARARAHGARGPLWEWLTR
jgi:radical SAM superfamily enzyme YgiQ (UPF0313 family)